MKKILNIILWPFKLILNIILWPFKAIKNLILKKQIENEKLKRTNIIQEYIKIAKRNNLKIMITSNYDNELIINMHDSDAKKGSVRKVKPNNENNI